MWFILMCVNFCDVDMERRAGWDYDSARSRRPDDVSSNPDYRYWDESLNAETSKRVSRLSGQAFESRKACMTALKRALPRGESRHDGAGFEVEYHHDYVEEHLVVDFIHAFYSGDYACFRRHRAPAIS